MLKSGIFGLSARKCISPSRGALTAATGKTVKSESV
jgi:hypothetical protein